MSRRMVGFSLVLATALVLSWFLYSTALLPSWLRSAPEIIPIPIVIVRFQTLHSGLIHIAVAKGYLAEAGLTATLKTILTGHEAIDQVLGGQADVGTSAETPFAMALAEGRQPKILATIFASQWSSGIVARKDSGIFMPADLKGKRIGYVFGTNTHYDLETFLEFHNIALGAVTLVPGLPPQLVRDLVSGNIDAASIWMPFMSQMQEKLGKNAQTFLAPGFYAQTVNLFVGPDFMRLHHEAGIRLLKALYKAELFVQAYPDEALDIIAAASNLKAGALRGHGDPLTYELTLKQSLLLATENQIRWYFRRGFVAKRAFPDVLSAFETVPLHALKPASVTIVK